MNNTLIGVSPLVWSKLVPPKNGVTFCKIWSENGLLCLNEIIGRLADSFTDSPIVIEDAFFGFKLYYISVEFGMDDTSYISIGDHAGSFDEKSFPMEENRYRISKHSYSNIFRY